MLRLAEAGRIRIRLVDPDIVDKKLRLTVYGIDGKRAGHFDVRRRPLLSSPLAPGTYEVRVQCDGLADQKLQAVVRSLEETRLELR